jgi:flagellar assembly factor FliW
MHAFEPTGADWQEARCLPSRPPVVTLPVRPENVFRFPEGVPAFESAREFVFLAEPDTRPFFFLQAIGPLAVRFVCIDPFLVCPGYRPNLSASDVRFLGLARPEDAFVASIVTVTPDPRDILANLQGPVIVNLVTCVGRQIICEGQTYPVRYRIWDAVDGAEEPAPPAPHETEAGG